MKNLLTTSQPVGVLTRYLSVVLMTSITVVGMMNWLSPEQVKELTDMLPGFIEALSALMTAGVIAYATITKSMSDRGAEVAQQTDAKIPKADPVEVVTPDNRPNIVVPAK